MKCPNCGKEINKGAAYCVYCEKPVRLKQYNPTNYDMGGYYYQEDNNETKKFFDMEFASSDGTPDNLDAHSKEETLDITPPKKEEPKEPVVEVLDIMDTPKEEVNPTLESSDTKNEEPKKVNEGEEKKGNIEFQGSTYKEKKRKSFKDKKNIFLIIIIVVIILLIGIFIGHILIKSRLNNDDVEEPLENDDLTKKSFFIKNKDGNYALFDSNGNQLSDFVYNDINEFINGYTLVKKNNEYGIISVSNREYVKFGTYQDIEKVLGVYKVTNGSTTYLIEGNGNVIYDMSNAYVKKFNNTKKYFSLIDMGTKKINIIDYDGHILKTIDVVNDNYEFQYDEQDNILAFQYNNKVYIYDLDNREEITSFSSTSKYCVDTVTDDKILINNCSDSKLLYKVILNNKTYDVDGTCLKVSLIKDKLTCTDSDNKSYILDDNFNKSVDVTEKSYESINNYAINNGNNVEFYVEGKKTKTIECYNLFDPGYKYNGIYILKSVVNDECNNKEVTYGMYNIKGKQIDKASYKEVKYLNDSDYMIGVNGKSYVLIDNTGLIVSKSYSEMDMNNGYFVVKNGNNVGLINAVGEEVVPCKYTNIEISGYDNNYVLLTTKDEVKIVHDVSNDKDVVSLFGTVRLLENYIEVKSTSKTKYYSYETGKSFYEV